MQAARGVETSAGRVVFGRISLIQVPEQLRIAGEVQPAPSGGSIPLVDPATEKPWHAVPAAGRAEVDRALESARDAFRDSGWASPQPRERSVTLLRLAALIREEAEGLARLEARNVGKPIGDARWEIGAGARCFEYYAGAIARFVGETIPVSAEGLDFTLHVPHGVVAAIVPWNFPFLIACWKVAPALATGNAVVLKPASLTPVSAMLLGELAERAGVPRGILQVLPGRGADVGDYLVAHPLVRKVAFTGDTETGARILRVASDHIKRVSLELGGKSPCIVFADADVEAAAKAAPMSVFANAGQDCCARSRIFVERPVYERFRDAFVAATRSLAVGDPMEDRTQVGPLVSAGQRERVEGYLALAREEGGRVLTGGGRLDREGYFLEPAIVEGLGNAARVCQEEIFGPVACLLPFDGEAQAIELANRTRYGLSGSLWTKDVERALRVSRAIETGVLSVNCNNSVHQEAPFGGFKHSGFGRDLGFEAMKLYTELKNIFIRAPAMPSH